MSKVHVDSIVGKTDEGYVEIAPGFFDTNIFEVYDDGGQKRLRLKENVVLKNVTVDSLEFTSPRRVMFNSSTARIRGSTIEVPEDLSGNIIELQRGNFTGHIRTSADVGGHLSGRYFVLTLPTGAKRIYYLSEGGSASPPDLGFGSEYEIVYTENATAPEVAAAIADGISNDPNVSMLIYAGNIIGTNQVNLTAAVRSAHIDIADGSTGFSIERTQQSSGTSASRIQGLESGGVYWLINADSANLKISPVEGNFVKQQGTGDIELEPGGGLTMIALSSTRASVH